MKKDIFTVKIKPLIYGQDWLIATIYPFLDIATRERKYIIKSTGLKAGVIKHRELVNLFENGEYIKL